MCQIPAYTRRDLNIGTYEEKHFFQFFLIRYSSLSVSTHTSTESKRKSIQFPKFSQFKPFLVSSAFSDFQSSAFSRFQSHVYLLLTFQVLVKDEGSLGMLRCNPGSNVRKLCHELRAYTLKMSWFKILVLSKHYNKIEVCKCK